jgi:hypothetical protein
LSDEFDPDDQQDEELATINLGDPVLVKSRRDRHKRDTEEEELFWRSALGLRVGRRALYRLLTHAHTFETRFAATPTTSVGGGGFPDPNATWFQAGIQDYGQFLLLMWMKIDFQNVHLMLEENDPRFAKPRVKKPPTR